MWIERIISSAILYSSPLITVNEHSIDVLPCPVIHIWDVYHVPFSMNVSEQ